MIKRSIIISLGAAGGNAVFDNAPSYFQLLVQREMDEAAKNNPERLAELKKAVDPKPRFTIVKVGKIKRIPKSWRKKGFMVKAFG